MESRSLYTKDSLGFVFGPCRLLSPVAITPRDVEITFVRLILMRFDLTRVAHFQPPLAFEYLE